MSLCMFLVKFGDHYGDDPSKFRDLGTKLCNDSPANCLQRYILQIARPEF